MNKPWFNMDPNDFMEQWWLKNNIVDRKKALTEKNNMDILCYLIIQDNNIIGSILYRISIWYKDDPNRYQCIKYNDEWDFDKFLKDMHEGDIVNIHNCKFKVYNCQFAEPSQLDFCKILERVSN